MCVCVLGGGGGLISSSFYFMQYLQKLKKIFGSKGSGFILCNVLPQIAENLWQILEKFTENCRKLILAKRN